MGKLIRVLEKEGISQAELSRISLVSTTTINKICTNSDFVLKGTTLGKIIKGLNKLTIEGKYSSDDII